MGKDIAKSGPTIDGEARVIPEMDPRTGPEKESIVAKKAKALALSLFDPAQYAVLGAEWRRGLKDAQHFVLQAFPDSMASRDEPGTIGNPAPTVWGGEEKGGKRGMEMGR